MNGSRILLLGLAYKRNTGDARESPATRIARLLVDMGADVRRADPHVAEENFRLPVDRVDLTAQELAESDAIVLLCDHDAFDFDLIARTRRLRARLSTKACSQLQRRDAVAAVWKRPVARSLVGMARPGPDVPALFALDATLSVSVSCSTPRWVHGG